MGLDALALVAALIITPIGGTPANAGPARSPSCGKSPPSTPGETKRPSPCEKIP